MDILSTIMIVLLSTMLVLLLLFLIGLNVYFAIDCILDIKKSIKNLKNIMKEGSYNENEK